MRLLLVFLISTFSFQTFASNSSERLELGDIPFVLNIWVTDNCTNCAQMIEQAKIVERSAGTNSKGWNLVRVQVWNADQHPEVWRKYHLRHAKQALGEIVTEELPSLIVWRWLWDSIGPADGHTVEDFWIGPKDSQWIFQRLEKIHSEQS